MGKQSDIVLIDARPGERYAGGSHHGVAEGHIPGAINVSSMAAVRFAPYPMLAYSSSKAGVNALTRSVAMQYAQQGVRSNCIMPGLINTPMAIEGLSKRLGIPMVLDYRDPWTDTYLPERPATLARRRLCAGRLRRARRSLRRPPRRFRRPG